MPVKRLFLSTYLSAGIKLFPVHTNFFSKLIVSALEYAAYLAPLRH